ncbi:bifunctional metallophosphatase/5'-nucleotidase [Salinicoccus sp. ID82-1]|uniref:Bifunctional metallophosphatase/5'-nucleotidase n=1 Tax=Salinicoccus cyprini TaxID=2493691 RepID=A0A558AWX0_9STAP|nr:MULTISPECIES: bifunctional UDP-sugar hydrolase/5'-nucleotidase [Salinicoccus]MCG1010108.1 bifunctional metallophosphatase/5'-nucleotidase [Salinicoccus sp. ID82-1]TVT28731.1 bifunctional metallophosphatase/5'-nucleotidase [Salinicoccus cyprini]
MEVKLFHTNDIHSHLYNYLKIKDFLHNKKRQHKHNMVYVDLGDHVDRSHPYTEATLGKGNIDILNDAGCEVATIGNNEGITLQKEDLKSLYDNADFDVICANLREVGSESPYFRPYVIKEINGIKFGFIAATVEFTPFYKALGWEVSESFDWILEAIREINTEVDCIVMMSHLGRYDDESLAMMFPEIDVILSSHTHHYFEEGEWIGDTLLAAAGRYGDYVGEVTLEFDEKTLVGKRARLYDTDLLTSSDDHYYEMGRDMLSTVIKDSAAPIERRLYSTSSFITSLARMVRLFTDSDASLIHTGLIVKPFEGGMLTDYDLHKVLPHAINTVQIELTGRELKEIFSQASKHEFKDEIIRGLGFRGDIFGCFVAENIGYVQSEREYYINGEVIEDRRHYTLGTLDMYTFGRIFPQFRYSRKVYKMPEFLRDIVKIYSSEL